MSSSAAEVVSTTTGMRPRSSSFLISWSTSRPSRRGRLRSRRMRSGRTASTYAPSRRRYDNTSAPSDTTVSRLRTLCSSNASCVMSTSPGSSSTSSTSMGVSSYGAAPVMRSPPQACPRGPRCARCTRSCRCLLRHALAALAALGALGHAVTSFPAWLVRRDRRRQREVDRRTLVHVEVEPDPSAMVFDDLLDDRQADSGPLVGVPCVQPLEDHEHLVGELGLDADPVVANGDPPLL